MTRSAVEWTKARELLCAGCDREVRRERVALAEALGRVAAPEQEEPAAAFLAGRVLTGAALTAAAGAGLAGLDLAEPPRLALLETGSGPGTLSALAGWIAECGGSVGPTLQGAPADLGEVLEGCAPVDLLLVPGAEAIPAAAGAPLFAGLAMAPGAGTWAARPPAGPPVVGLPADLWELFVAFQVVVAPAVRRLAGREESAPGGTAPLLFSKAWPEEERRWYPGRRRQTGDGARVEHLAPEPAHLADLDCLFTVPAKEWMRDGDRVDWIHVGR